MQAQKSLRCRFPGQGVDVPASVDSESNIISCCVPSSVRPLSEERFIESHVNPGPV